MNLLDLRCVQAVTKTLGIHGIKSNLEKFEIPRMISLAPEVINKKLHIFGRVIGVKNKHSSCITGSKINAVLLFMVRDYRAIKF